MLLYGDIVKKVLDEEALPILRDVVDTSLTARFGEEWYTYFARAILEGYSEFKQIDAFVAGGKGKAIEALDINAICYLVMPYDKDLKMYLDGAMPMIEEKFGLEANPERLKRIRTIRNNVTRSKVDADMEEDEATLVSGVQEKKWLQDIENTLKEFRPELSLESYVQQLDEQIARRAQLAAQLNEAVNKRPSVEEVRDAYKETHRFAFTDAPVNKGIVGKAPWVSLNDDLDKLPWPSAVAKAEEQAAENFADMAQKIAGNAALAAAEDTGFSDLADTSFATADTSAAAPAQAPAAAPMQINVEEFLKPAPADQTAKKIPGAAPNEDVSEKADDKQTADETKEKGVSKLFGWLKGKK